MGLRNKVKFDFSRTEDKLKLIILASATLLILGVAVAGGISLTMSPEFCKLCHKTMTPEYVTWKNSSHSQIACVECHMEPGVVNLALEKLTATRHLYLYLTGGYKKEWPIQVKNPVPSHICEQCHSVANRNFTVSGDLKIPHLLHGEKGVDCVQCHSGVAHGNIAERGATVNTDVTAWTVEKEGKDNMAPAFIRPDMDKCVACHMDPAQYGIKDVKSVPWSCETCHKNITTPQSHRTGTWLSGHGLEAEKGVQACAACHAVGSNKDLQADGVQQVTTTNLSVQNYVWNTPFCVNCHSQKPKDHQDQSQWLPHHKEAVAAKQFKNCEACHSIQQPKAGETLKSPAKEVTCNNCHWFNL